MTDFHVHSPTLKCADAQNKDEYGYFIPSSTILPIHTFTHSPIHNIPRILHHRHLLQSIRFYADAVKFFANPACDFINAAAAEGKLAQKEYEEHIRSLIQNSAKEIRSVCAKQLFNYSKYLRPIIRTISFNRSYNLII